jgi:hypothetical protein
MLEEMAHDHFHALRYTEQPKGLAASAMSSAQREILESLVHSYINRMPDAIAEIEMSKLKTHGLDGLHMAWAGGIEKREGHYYRLQGLDFLVEYDNIQNDANHIHSVWREPSNDFGADLLAHHYHSSHHSHTPHKH